LDLPEVALDLPTPQKGKDFPVRVWLHRVDSVERVKFAEERYQGIEIDVVFDSNGRTFDVGHPPAPSIGLSLETLIASLKDPWQHFYWIDFKNLTLENKRQAAFELSRIAQRFSIIARMIVESAKAEHLDEFSRKGFYTSYYLPNINPYALPQDQLKDYVRGIAGRLARSQVNAISSDHLQYELIRRYFPGYDVLLWYPTKNFIAYAIRERKLLADPRVKVLLRQEISPGYR
jgi:heptose-I-phosphate ethanolaminephosphotransferase